MFEADAKRLFDALRSALHRLGWPEDERVVYAPRFPNESVSGDLATLTMLARELAAANLDVIVAMGTPNARLLKAATTTTPIVFLAEKPVENGLVASLARPASNLTGVTYHIDSLLSRRLHLLKQAVPSIVEVGFLAPRGASVADTIHEGTHAAAVLKLKWSVVELAGPDELHRTLVRADAWMVDDFAAFHAYGERIVAALARLRKPAIFSSKDWTHVGGLMAYSDDRSDVMQRVAKVVDRVLRGAKPAELPVEQPLRFVLSLNLNAARQLGITIPQRLLLQADEVIG